MTYVLIPGGGGAAAYWHLVADEMRRRGHQAIAVDLPADDENAAFAEYADVVIDAARDADDVTLVAQSLGGFTAPLVASRRPVREIVFVNAMIPAVGESGGEWGENTGSSDARRRNDEQEGRDPDAEFNLDVYFFHDVPAEEIDVLASAARNESDAVFTQPYPLAEWPRVPMRVIATKDDRFFPVEFQRRVAQDRLGITPTEIPGGHLVALSQPVALVDQIVGRRPRTGGVRLTRG